MSCEKHLNFRTLMMSTQLSSEKKASNSMEHISLEKSIGKPHLRCARTNNGEASSHLVLQSRQRRVIRHVSD
jgi:hypothetical protein